MVITLLIMLLVHVCELYKALHMLKLSLAASSFYGNAGCLYLGLSFPNMTLDAVEAVTARNFDQIWRGFDFGISAVTDVDRDNDQRTTQVFVGADGDVEGFVNAGSLFVITLNNSGMCPFDLFR